ncbi:PAS domain-containing protein [Shewanella sp. 4t3-1-2LB]|uniref:PAS domain-containing protein n=1 Tax=Shewanella sp. 4t3-1-2LB TaxID=2817682 RepID=UPI001A99E605|nr:PAS domain-containing protein [Shewanella sp. 4t3-1-2LB]MBO1270132.1 PAS domain-containing protein [Shewanella sp. 4t3-1-2LB]
MTQLRLPHVSPLSRPSWRNSLSAKFIWVQLFVAFIIIASTIGVLWIIQRDQLLRQQQELNYTYGQVVISRLKEITGQYESLVIAMASVAGLYQQQPQKLQQLIPTMLDSKRQDDLISGGGIWPEPGEHPAAPMPSLFWYRDATNTLVQLSDYNRNAAMPYHTEEWYRPTRLYPADVAFWSPAYRDPTTGITMVTASVPVRVEHKFVGAATLDIGVNGINGLFHDLSRDLSGYIIALDYRNRLLSLPQGLQQHLPTNPSQVEDIQWLSGKMPVFSALRPALQNVDDAIIRQAQRQPQFTDAQLQTLPSLVNNHNDLLKAIVENTPQNWPPTAELIDTIELPQDPLLAEDAMVSVFLMPGTFWKILVVTPLSQLHHNAYMLAGKVGFFLVIIQLLAMLLLYLLQRRIFISPITQIAATLQNQDLAALEILQRERQDEFAGLANSFLNRVQQLEAEMASLYATNLAQEQQLQVQESFQQELRNRTEQLNSLLKFSQHIIHIKDLNGCYTLVNDKYCELLGREREQLLGHSDQQLFPNIEQPLTAQHEQRVLQTRAPFSAEEPLHIHQGGVRPFFVTRFAIRDELGELNGVGAIGFDLSGVKRNEVTLQAEIKQQQQQLQQLQQLVQQQKQQKLLVIQQQQRESRYQQQLLEKINQLQQQEQPLPRLLSMLVGRLSQQLDQLSAAIYQQPATVIDHQILQQAEGMRHLQALVNYQHNEIQPLELSQFFNHLLIFMAPELAAKQVQVNFNNGQRLIAVGKSWQHLLLFYRLLQNTINDAYLIDQPEKLLTISINNSDQNVSVELVDNGRGMDMTQQERLKQQWHQQTTDSTLTAVHYYLKTQLHGNMTLVSAPGKGCKITLSIPALV